MIGLGLLAGLVTVSIPHPAPGSAGAAAAGLSGPMAQANRVNQANQINQQAVPRQPVGSASRASAPPGRAVTPDGRVSFAVPAGWHTGTCPDGAADCVQVAPAGVDTGDSIAVVITGQAPGGSSGGDGYQRVKVAGVAAFRVDLPSNGSVLVSGGLPGSAFAFTVNCQYQKQEQLVRRGCEHVLQTMAIHAAPS